MIMLSEELSYNPPLFVVVKYVPICQKMVQSTDISIRTVLRRLSKEFGLKSYKPAAKPRLGSAIKKKKLSFANKRLYWTAKK